MENNQITIGSSIIDDFDLDEYVQISIIKDNVPKVLKTLTPKEEQVIRLRFGIGTEEPKTLEVVGRIFGVSRERIRSIEAKALRKLRHKNISQQFFIIDPPFNPEKRKKEEELLEQKRKMEQKQEQLKNKRIIENLDMKYFVDRTKNGIKARYYWSDEVNCFGIISYEKRESNF